MVYDVVTPIYGFEEIKKMDLEQIDDTFYSLKNVDDDGSPTFTLVNPFAFRNYEFDLPDTLVKDLQIKDAADVSVLNIMVVSSPIEESRINFAAPLIFNTKNKTFAQIILGEMKYSQYGLAEKISDYLK
ncbi:MAG: flagellar assembly protein FliW [Campylobacterota bacterium]